MEQWRLWPHMEGTLQAPVTWSAEQLVNTFALGDQTAPSLTALAGGGYVITWHGLPDPNASSYATYFQTYDAWGNKVGTEQVLDGSYADPEVVALANGGFAIVHTGGDAFLSGGILMSTFTADGTSLGAPVTVNSEDDPMAPNYQSEPAVAKLSNGGFAVGYFCTEPGGGQSMRIQRFDANGAKLGPEILVGVDPDGAVADLVIGAFGDDSFAASWIGLDGGYEVYMRVYGNDGAPQTGIVPLSNGIAQHQLNPAIASDGQTGLAIYYNGDLAQTVGQLFAADGTLLKPEFGISDGMQNALGGYYPEVTGLPGGGYFVVFMEYNASGFSQLVGQVLDGDGNKVGAETVIFDSGETDSIFRFKVAALADGRVVVTFDRPADTGADVDGSSIRSLIVDPRGGFVEGSPAAEILLGSAGDVADLMYGGSGDDELHGLGGNDTIYGGRGNDTLAGDGGTDTLAGGEGDDFFLVDLDDEIWEVEGEGFDTIHIEAMDYVLESGVAVEVLEMSGGTDSDITGNEYDQWLKGDSSNNKLLGLGGNDTLEGGGNVDWLEGGTGDDFYIVDSELDFVMEAANAGNDTVTADFSYSLHSRANVENLILTGGAVEGIGNGLNNKLTGNDDDNELYGEGGNDTLNGGKGADTMGGDAGNDVYVVDNIGDTVVELAGAGTDTVYAAFNHTLASSVERLVLTGSATKGTGNSADNLLVGNAAANTLTGGAGNDTFGGGEGVDQLVGGSGNDKYELGSSSDKITETSGTDTITTTISRSLASYSGIENLQLVGTSDINGSGNSGANTLLGNVGKNQLKGGGGADLLHGGEGKDLLWGGAGKDKFDFDSITEIGKWSSSRDVIRDFKHGSDKIDLRSIDAKSNVSGNNAFAFVAAEGAKFSGVKGQLIWDQKNHAGTSKDVTLVSGDLNGDKVADFTLELTGLHNLSKGDFIL